MKAKETEARYTVVRPHLNTFDIINCEHKDWPFKWIGHTAVVYKCPLTGQIFVYESTSLNKFGISGVQLTPMRIWLPRYPGTVKVAPLLYDGGPYKSGAYPAIARARRKSAEHIKKYRGTPYPDLKDSRERRFLAYAAIDLPLTKFDDNPDRHDIMFCVQLVVDLFQDCGLYTGDLPPSEFKPDDMHPEGEFAQMLAPGLSLGKQWILK